MRVAVLTLAIGAMMACRTAIAVSLAFVPNSTISISNVRTYCANNQPYVRLNLLINAADLGRLGLLYIGAHNPGQTQAQFYSDSWQDWAGSLFPIYKIASSGLYDTTIVLPLGDASQKQGWKLYAGYGALATADELTVQRAIETINQARAKIPERQISAIDLDFYRRVLAQDDMIKNVKYRYVLTWTPELAALCDRGGR